MAFTFKWDNENKTIMRYVAEGRWNWNEYHKVTRASTFHFHKLGHSADAMVDLRAATHMPGGIQAHIRTFVNRQTPNQSGRVVIIGMDAATQDKIGVRDGELRINDGIIRFVDDDEAAYTIIAQWRADDLTDV